MQIQITAMKTFTTYLLVIALSGRNAGIRDDSLNPEVLSIFSLTDMALAERTIAALPASKLEKLAEIPNS